LAVAEKSHLPKRRDSTVFASPRSSNVINLRCSAAKLGVRSVVGVGISMTQHTVKTFDQDLQRLDALIKEIGDLAAAQLGSALDAFARDDGALAKRVIGRDVEIDRLERDICRLALRIVALRQPAGSDLRYAFSAYKSATGFERIGDYAASIAKRFCVLQQDPPTEFMRSIIQMGRHAEEMTKAITEAFVARDADKALAVWLRDEELDLLHTALFRELLSYMIEDTRHVRPCTHLLFVGKNLERVGDHTTNIAETLHFLVHGTPLARTRAKRDRVSQIAAPLLETVEPIPTPCDSA
jgi:phosphate transport system protein